MGDAFWSGMGFEPFRFGEVLEDGLVAEGLRAILKDGIVRDGAGTERTLKYVPSPYDLFSMEAEPCGMYRRYQTYARNAVVRVVVLAYLA